MDPGVATDQRTVVYGESVWVRGTRGELRRLEYLAGCGFVPDQTGPAFGVVMAIVSRNQPNRAVVPCDAVVSGPSRNLIERDEEFRLP